MTLTPEQTERLRERITQTVRENASIQKTVENRTNYFNSCEKHDGLLKEVLPKIKQEFA